ncbi:MAG TPA: DoxX family protein, partial [Mycobacterium sp.]|nr:DoxX family protein [Mycobacterium sp.]
MVAVTDTLDRTDSPTPTVAPPAWHPVTRVAFRFCFIYFGLFCLWFAQITFVFT